MRQPVFRTGLAAGPRGHTGDWGPRTDAKLMGRAYTFPMLVSRERKYDLKHQLFDGCRTPQTLLRTQKNPACAGLFCSTKTANRCRFAELSCKT
jgi:hypothetical protein